MSERFWVEATGVCMWPAVREGDLLLCEPLGEKASAAGEVLVAHDGRGFIAHRLQSTRLVHGKERLLLKADLGEPDPPRDRQEIVGRVLLVYRQEEGLTDVTASLGRELDVGPFAAAILRRLARWHTNATKVRNALRNRNNPHLESRHGPAARSPDPGHLAPTRAATHGGLRHADFPGGS